MKTFILILHNLLNIIDLKWDYILLNNVSLFFFILSFIFSNHLLLTVEFKKHWVWRGSKPCIGCKGNLVQPRLLLAWEMKKKWRTICIYIYILLYFCVHLAFSSFQGFPGIVVVSILIKRFHLNKKYLNSEYKCKIWMYFQYASWKR